MPIYRDTYYIFFLIIITENGSAATGSYSI